MMSYIEINFSKKLSLVIFNESLTSRTTKISAEDQSIVLQNRAQKKRVTNFPHLCKILKLETRKPEKSLGSKESLKSEESLGFQEILGFKLSLKSEKSPGFEEILGSKLSLMSDESVGPENILWFKFSLS